MANQDHSSPKPRVWTRDEISDWLESQPPEFQEVLKGMGRLMLKSHAVRDLADGYSTVRRYLENGWVIPSDLTADTSLINLGMIALKRMSNRGIRPLVAQQAPAMQVSSPGGWFGMFKDMMLGAQEARIYGNLANLGNNHREQMNFNHEAERRRQEADYAADRYRNEMLQIERSRAQAEERERRCTIDGQGNKLYY